MTHFSSYGADELGGGALAPGFVVPFHIPSVLEYDESTIYDLQDMVSILGILFVNRIAVTSGEVFDPAKWLCMDRTLKTGVISGGLITISGAGTTFDVSAMTGIIVDNSDPSNYSVKPVS